MEQDSTTTSLNVDITFSVEIPDRALYQELPMDKTTINCYTDGSKMEGDVGAAVYITKDGETVQEASYYLGSNSTVFQAETYAINQAATLLLQDGTHNQNIVIHCDSQAAIMAIDNSKIKSKTTLNAANSLSALGSSNRVLLRWVPAHSGYSGNEKVDSLAKRGAKNLHSTTVALPIPKVIGHSAIRKRTLHKTDKNLERHASIPLQAALA